MSLYNIGWDLVLLHTRCPSVGGGTALLILKFHLLCNTQLLIIFTSRTFRPGGLCQLLTCKQLTSIVYCSARKFHNYEPLQLYSSPLLSLPVNLRISFCAAFLHSLFLSFYFKSSCIHFPSIRLSKHAQTASTASSH